MRRNKRLEKLVLSDLRGKRFSEDCRKCGRFEECVKSFGCDNFKDAFKIDFGRLGEYNVLELERKEG